MIAKLNGPSQDAPALFVCANLLDKKIIRGTIVLKKVAVITKTLIMKEVI
jgi:hypothetical protein